MFELPGFEENIHQSCSPRLHGAGEAKQSDLHLWGGFSTLQHATMQPAISGQDRLRAFFWPDISPICRAEIGISGDQKEALTVVRRSLQSAQRSMTCSARSRQ